MHMTMPGQQRGVGLLEVLIAVIVMSLGFLGMAALQIKSLSANNSAMSHTAVTIAGYAMADALHIDAKQASRGRYNTTVTTSACPDANGSLAGTQLRLWCRALSRTLGKTNTTRGTIECTTAGQCTITITFDDGHDHDVTRITRTRVEP